MEMIYMKTWKHEANLDNLAERSWSLFGLTMTQWQNVTKKRSIDETKAQIATGNIQEYTSQILSTEHKLIFREAVKKNILGGNIQFNDVELPVKGEQKKNRKQAE